MEFNKSINDAISNSVIMENRQLVLNALAGTDYFNSPDGSQPIANAPLLLTETDNTQPFTFTARVIPEFKNINDAGSLFLYINNGLWQKLAFEMDEQKNTRIISVRTIDTSDDNNHSIILENSVYLKISSDTRQIGFYYSPDNEIWNLVRLYRNSYPPVVYMGVSSQSPHGDGCRSLFDEISLTKESVKDFRMGT